MAADALMSGNSRFSELLNDARRQQAAKEMDPDWECWWCSCGEFTVENRQASAAEPEFWVRRCTRCRRMERIR